MNSSVRLLPRSLLECVLTVELSRCVVATSDDLTSRRSLRRHLGNADGLSLELAPDYNVAPTTMQPVITWDDEFGTRTLHMMFWKFLPRYVTDPKQFKLRTINAKSETLLSNKILQDSFVRRRCLIPADLFLQWKKEGKRRLPFVFAMKDDQPFALGGVWRRWRSPDRKTEMDTFAIITVEPNELVAEKTGHDR